MIKSIKYTWIYILCLSCTAIEASSQSHNGNAKAAFEESNLIDTAIDVGNQAILRLDLKGVQLTGVEPAPVNDDWQAIGFTQMPVYVTDPEQAAARTMSDCIAYYNYAFWVPNDDIQGAGVFIYEFPDKQKLATFIADAAHTDLRRHLQVGQFYIQVWSFYNDPDIAKEHLDILQAYYENLGAKLYVREE